MANTSEELLKSFEWAMINLGYEDDKEKLTPPPKAEDV